MSLYALLAIAVALAIGALVWVAPSSVLPLLAVVVVIGLIVGAVAGLLLEQGRS